MKILPQSRKVQQNRVYLVRPTVPFSPKSWQESPKRFSIVERLAITTSPGKADAMRFSRNHAAITSGNVSQWVVLIRD